MLRTILQGHIPFPKTKQASIQIPRLDPRRQLFRRAPRYPHDPGIYHHYDLHSIEEPRLRTRILRSMIWAMLFGSAGIYSALLYRTWVYKGVGSVVPDSELDADLVEDIKRQIDDSPMVQALKNDSTFDELWPLALTEDRIQKMLDLGYFEEGKDHFLLTALRGTRGVFPRAFWCADRAILCMIVGFGYGVEGAPSQVHNGILTAMVDEAMRVLAGIWMAGNKYTLVDLDVNFTYPLLPHSICCIMVMPSATVSNLEPITSEPELYGHWPSWMNTTDWEAKVNTFIAYVSQSDGHPLHDPSMIAAYSAGRFQVEGAEWPPEQPSPPLQLDLEGNIT